MKRSLGILLGIPNIASGIHTYYVDSATGNDAYTAIQAMNPATPWATIYHAYATIPITGGCQILVNAGTYSEVAGATKYVILSRVFTNWVTIRAWHTGDTVIWQDAASGTYAFYVNGAQKLRLQNLTLTQAGANANPLMRILGSADCNLDFVGCTLTSRNYCVQATSLTKNLNLTFTDCTISKRVGDTAAVVCIQAQCADGSNATITLNNCTITGQSPTTAYHAVEMRQMAGTGTNSLVINGGTITSTGTGYGVWGLGCDLQISNAAISSDSSVAVVFGADDTPAYNTTGSITGGSVSSNSSHSLLIGQLSQDVVATGVAVTGGDYGTVVKGVNVVIDGCAIAGGTLSSILLKGCTNPTIQNCTLAAHASGFAGLSFTLQDTTKVDGVTFIGNHVTASITADCIVVPASTILIGTVTFDYNNYDYSGTGNVGDINPTNNITDLAGLQAAWATYGVPANDAHSSVM